MQHSDVVRLYVQRIQHASVLQQLTDLQRGKENQPRSKQGHKSQVKAEKQKTAIRDCRDQLQQSKETVKKVGVKEKKGSLKKAVEAQSGCKQQQSEMRLFAEKYSGSDLYILLQGAVCMRLFYSN